jgi:2,4-diketo-3-deoxy-L-fuconate hydrolase
MMPQKMRLVGFDDVGETWIGQVFKGDELLGEAWVGGLLKREEFVVPIARRHEFWVNPLAERQLDMTTARAIASVRVRPAIPETARIVCIGLNYRTHATEIRQPMPTVPVVFGRWPSTLSADGDEVPLFDETFDWEGELGVVIGAELSSVDEKGASKGIFGYAACNDLTSRKLQTRTQQWTLGKNCDSSCPIGPVVTVGQAGDPASGWRVTTRVNGELMQDGATSDLIFSVPNIVSYLSEAMTLLPGDLILTGTPGGVGAGRVPPIFLRAGDRVTVEVANVGSVTSVITARGLA